MGGESFSTANIQEKAGRLKYEQWI